MLLTAPPLLSVTWGAASKEGGTACWKHAQMSLRWTPQCLAQPGSATHPGLHHRDLAGNWGTVTRSEGGEERNRNRDEVSLVTAPGTAVRL